MYLLAFALSLPSWLELHPGAQPQTNSSPGLIESFYTLAAKPAEAAEHFKPVFAKANLSFAPNADGIGLSARVAAPECDLLLQFHPNPKGTTVRINCAEKTAPANDFYIPAATSRVTLGQNRHRDMARYDQPVAVKKGSFYNNDAPPLAWPAWLQLKGARGSASPSNTSHNSAACLESRYATTTVPMSELVSYYESLFDANRFRVPTMRLQTGQTWDGKIMQNKSGRVEGSQSADGSVSGPSIHITADFNRSVVNGPISVSLRVCVKGSFGRR